MDQLVELKMVQLDSDAFSMGCSNETSMLTFDLGSVLQ